MNKSCKPVFKFFKGQRKTKFLIHGFGDNVRESYMAPALRDGKIVFLLYLTISETEYDPFI